jgi:ubiquinone/menaquinone biosynthesis C-methylase UbiE
VSNARATKATRKLTKPGGLLGDGGPPVSLFGKVYARCYDFFMDRIDRDGAAEHRQRLVEEAGGEVLEIGAGTGKNLPLYRAAERVVALDPDPGMRARAHEAAREARVPVEVVEGDAVALPFGDASFDTVVFSLVLCTIPDMERALSEARRVLRPGGTLRFYEHVRAADPHLARWQDRLERPWGWIGRGCHPNRDTPTAVAEAGFGVLSLEEFDFPAVPSIVRPHVIGIAEAP